MPNPTFLSSIALTLGVLLATAGTDAAAAPLTTASGNEVQYSDSGATPLVTYSETAGAVGAGPSLTLYGDGTAIAEYPPGWKRAGRHRTQLSQAELDALVATLVDAGVVDFDTEAVRHAVQMAEGGARAAGSSGEIPIVADADVTTIAVTLDRYQRAGGPPATGVAKRVTWTSLARDVRLHPSITALGKLESARQALHAVLVRGDYTRED